MTPNITPSTASDKGELYGDIKLQVEGIVHGQRNWVRQLTDRLTSIVVNNRRDRGRSYPLH
jgi:hypothetical protein